MPCEKFPIPGGMAVVCSRRGRMAPCQVSGCTHSHVALCDYPIKPPSPGTYPRRDGSQEENKFSCTCDMRLCENHRWRVSNMGDTDYCPAHRKLAQASMGPRR